MKDKIVSISDTKWGIYYSLSILPQQNYILKIDRYFISK